MNSGVAESVLVRAAGSCERCGLGLTALGHSLHHRKLRSQGGPDTAENLAALCGSGTTGCHMLVHSYPEQIGRPGGWIVPHWQDPAGVAVDHWLEGWVLLTKEGYIAEGSSIVYVDDEGEEG